MWRAWEKKDCQASCREMLIEAVERFFGAVESVPAYPAIDFLSDNGETYIATKTRALALACVRKPIDTAVCSPQSSGMAESFKRVLRGMYVTA